MKLLSLIALLSTTLISFSCAQRLSPVKHVEVILPGAAQPSLYLPLIKGKSVAVFANNTSMIGNTHLVDSLLSNQITIKKIFAPEHGFRGTASAGEKVENSRDNKTGIEVISLYGAKRKPSAEDLKDVDVLIFDIQDVGTRFYTYISHLQDYIEAAIEHDKPLLIFDRPNPNGFYVDGPVLDRKFRSFVGMQPVPVVYGMTIGEYGKMLVGEYWLDSTLQQRYRSRMSSNNNGNGFRLQVIPCANYTHKSAYDLPIKPSPNLPDMSAVYWYPSTCFFEGTVLSEGRGTDKPFQMFGHPDLPKNLISFTPRSKEGATNPKLKDQRCYGWDISGPAAEVLKQVNGRIHLKWLIDAYKLFPDKEKFFLANNFFNRLAGNDILMKQIKEGKSEAEIRDSWKPGLDQFRLIRKKYLLYVD
jgi:uncharacterized protein YbbC (DUF1343 family)